jgi:hypothetical protein
MTPAEVLALADTVAAGARPAEAEEQDMVAAAVAEALARPVIERIPEDVPGVRVAYRPPPRPGSVTAAAAAPAPGPTEAELVTPAVAPGTVLVQLGAYESAQVAAADWESLSAVFAEFMGGKARVIQAAETSGESFFRLRAQGFAGMEDANRFCAVLIAEGARCVPVVAE